MYWGHAVSRDLVHWEKQPIVLHPDELGTMFSGTAVLDEQNTTSFGSKRRPAIVAAYTADNAQKEIQCLAYSLDDGQHSQNMPTIRWLTVTTVGIAMIHVIPNFFGLLCAWKFRSLLVASGYQYNFDSESYFFPLCNSHKVVVLRSV